MAQVVYDETTGLFDAVVGDQSVGDVTDPADAAEILEEENEDGALEDQENLSDVIQALTVEDTETSEEVPDDVSYDDLITPLAAVPSTAAFTPVAWQSNLAAHRPMGQHYLMYANRVYYSGSSSYWHYFLVLGNDIEYADDLYTYADCDVYSYYSYNNTVYYDRNVASGTLDGTAMLVYSDLYFDYVGVDPSGNSSIYVLYALLLVIIVLLIVRGKSHV